MIFATGGIELRDVQCVPAVTQVHEHWFSVSYIELIKYGTHTYKLSVIAVRKSEWPDDYQYDIDECQKMYI